MEDELDKLMKPLFDALPEETRDGAKKAYQAEKSGVLAWGVRSGYLLWVRTHPGQTPTLDQIATWQAIANLKHSQS